MTADDRAPARVLVVEDDEDLRIAVTAELGASGLRVDGARDLAEADEALSDGASAGGSTSAVFTGASAGGSTSAVFTGASARYDCVVFDRMLPDGDAADYVQRRRQEGWAVPVLFLTARDSLADRVAGFEHGGDDYLVKPFAVAEMTARVLALCRHSGAGRPSVLRHGNLEMDCARRQVRQDGVLLTLSDKEFAVLEYLLFRPAQAVSRGELIEHCWDTSTDPMSNVVDVVVRRLRVKLRDSEFVQTVRGHGYRLAETRQGW